MFLRDVSLFAQPFDAGRAELIGNRCPSRTALSLPIATGGLFSVSETGTLAYRGGAGGQPRLTALDRQGKSVGSMATQVSTRIRRSPRTPAGLPLRPAPAWARELQATSGLWTPHGEPARASLSIRLTKAGGLGRRMEIRLFTSSRAGHSDLYEKPADGSGEERLLLKSDEDKFAPAWSLDGRFLIYATNSLKTGNNLWVLPMEGMSGSRGCFSAEFNELLGQFSRMALDRVASNETEIVDIYVRPFSPDATVDASPSGPKWMISKGGGIWPRWRNDGRELLYITLGSQQTTVEVNADKSFDAGVPKSFCRFPECSRRVGT